MSIAPLRELLREPAAPVEADSADHWKRAEQAVGTALSADWREFCQLYGSGSIWPLGLSILNPFAESQRSLMLEDARRYAEDKAHEDPDDYPYDVFPPAGGLLPCGMTDQRVVFFYRTKGKPDVWPIVIWRIEDADWNEHAMSVTDFLAGPKKENAMSDPLDYGGDAAKAAAIARLEKLGASIGEIDDTSVHVELKPCFGGTPIGDAVIPQVVQDVNALGNVGTLDLGETAITDAAMVHLAELRGVKDLYLNNDKITDDGVKYLSALGELESLVLSGTSVSDAAVPHLSRMKGLRFLQAFGTGLTPAGVAALKRALPHLKVEGFK